jgi:hypothetical protein
MQVNTQSSPTRQGRKSPLKKFICDLRLLRGEMLSSERLHRSGILAGQLLILASEYQRGRQPSRRKLRGFLRLICGEEKAAA